MRFSRVLLPAFFIVSAAFAAPPQRETATVEVVQVPVYVTTSGGSVRGLTRDDFDLRVNGRRQAIDYFDVIDFAALSSEQTRDPRQRRLYVLTFDIANSSFESMLRAKRAAAEYLAAAQPADYFAVALLNHRNDIEFLVPFTRDQVMLRHAVTSFNSASKSDPLRLTAGPVERGSFIDNQAEIAELWRTGGGMAEMLVDVGRGRVADQMDALGQLAERMAPIEGVKHVVVLSDGFENSILMTGLRQRRSNLQDMRAPELGARNAQQNPVMLDSRVATEQRGMYRKFAAAGVFLDAIDIAGLRPYDAAPNDSLHFLVADTGGRVIENQNNLTHAMQRLTDSQQIAYVLGFRAPETGRKENSISVHVSGAPRGSRVAYREAYSSIPEKPTSRDGLRLADIVTNDIPQNGMTMTADVSTNARRATVNVVVPGRELLALAGNEATVKGEALIYVFADQASIAFAQKGIDVDVSRASAGGLAAGKLEFTQSFDLPPGKYAMKVLVRITGQETLAFARRDFTIE
jgi:VWFA-related protein